MIESLHIEGIIIFFDYRKLYVTKSDFLIDVGKLHCLYNTHKFRIRQVDSIFTVIS